MACKGSRVRISLAPLTAAASWLLYFLSLVPLFILGFYNYPSADDINMGIPAHEAFQATGNVFAALGQGIYMAWYDYMNWMGYFTSTAFMSVPPNVFGDHAYPAGVFILTLSLTAATVFFLHTLLVRYVGMDRTKALIVPALTLFFSLQPLPKGMARVEALYWYCSGANYILTWCLGLCFLALLILAAQAQKHRIALITAACLLGFLTGGGNYMTALSCSIVAVLALVYSVIPANGGISSARFRHLLPPVLFLMAGFLASCLAPGNAVRGSIVEGYGALKSIGISLYYTLDYCILQWTRFEHLLLLLFLAPVFWEEAPRARLRFRYPALIALLAFGIASANVTPPLYAIGNLEAGRLQATFYIQYILLMVLLEGYLIGWLRMRVLKNPTASGTHPLYYVCISAAFFAGSALCVIPEPDYYTATEALRELTDGSAATYRRENEERLAILTDESITDAVLSPYSVRPPLLFYSEPDADEGNWLNDGLARYYHKNSVRLNVTDVSETEDSSVADGE